MTSAHPLRPALLLLCLLTARTVAAAQEGGSYAPLPFSPRSGMETVVLDYGCRHVRAPRDKRLTQPALMKNRRRCFLVVSKKDYYLYVYEPQGRDTVLLARYDVAVGAVRGQKREPNDMRTPHGTFVLSAVEDAAQWRHDFADGRGEIPSYGSYFLRLEVRGFAGIGIHGSTNNDHTVPGRASEGCIRMNDADVLDLTQRYCRVGMTVTVKSEEEDDRPFEIRAMRRQQIPRLRHLSALTPLTNEAVSLSWALPGAGRADTLEAARKVCGGDTLLWPAHDLLDSLLRGEEQKKE